MIQFENLAHIDGYIDSFGPALDLGYSVRISTDTRTIGLGETFLGIEGEKFRPLNFLHTVKNCKLVICENTSLNKEIAKSYTDIRFVFVENAIKYLQNLGRYVAHKFIEDGGTLIGINGSNGKTTTKEMLYHIMKSVEPETICTVKNNNNHIGVPLTILNINKKTKYCILELGSNHPGEIKTLCDIANPNVGITTNIGDTHLEFFGTREEVFKDEGYLYHSIIKSPWNNKKFFLNADDEYLSRYKKLDSKVVSYGKMGEDYKLHCTSSSAQVYLNGVKYVLDNEYITGEHNFFNLCIATIISKELLGREISQLCSYANSFRPTANRSEWISLENTKVFLDAYNANPSSMRVAIKGFCDEVQSEGIKNQDQIFILGDMNELGSESHRFHREIGLFVKELKVKNLICIGRFASETNKGFGGNGIEYKDVEKFKQKSMDILTKYKRVFIKGSRSLQLESILDIQ